ncbi:MAG: glycoside hydrolase family 4 [Actinomycetia bacterium]|nr:glycoside hydrolase family 4 [Actinomycetes bacterium]
MGPRIAIIGGGSYQWIPKLLTDLANTKSLQDCELVIEDINPDPIPRMIELVEHIASVRGIGMTARGTSDQRDALDGADFVLVCISTGGFESMAFDLEIPEKYGIKQSVGDSVGPGGIIRSQRNIPVFQTIARDMADLCPDAWLLNLTNPMTALCRSVTRESPIRTIGLCHEVTIMQFMLSMMLGVGFMDVNPTVAGVNHLPFVTALELADGGDGLAQLRDLVAHVDERGGDVLPMQMPADLGHEKISEGGDWTKADLLHANRLKLELFQRFGVLPSAGDRHVAEFFAGFLTEESGWGERWGVDLTPISGRVMWQDHYEQEFEELLAADEISRMPSGEMVAGVIDSLMRDVPRTYPLNIPNDGQVQDLPEDVVVESMCVVDGSGVRGRDEVSLPSAMAAHLRQVSAAQELTVEAALTGSRDAVIEAMLLDPLAGRIDFDAMVAMTDEMLDATKRWLPQYA